MDHCDLGETTVQASQLHYDLPSELIAQRPCEPRDAARLMVVHRQSGAIEHRVFRDLPDYLRLTDCLVLNKTKVLPARFVARRATGGRIEGLFLQETSPGVWRVLLNGAGKLKHGEALELSTPVGGRAERMSEAHWRLIFRGRLERGECEVAIEPAASAMEVLSRIGVMPLPPYIDRREEDASIQHADFSDYQTVYASEPGAVAAPTAGLHFTPQLLKRVASSGVQTAEVVLHVGQGTFQPIEVDDLAEHQMHHEWYSLSAESAQAIQNARAIGGRAIAVGTTSVRVLETCIQAGPLHEGQGWTNIFIYPPYEFRAVDALITNFHLPDSTLLALIYAFAGRDLAMTAYAKAMEERYRFYSYGDAMLIL